MQLFEPVAWWHSQVVDVLSGVDYQKLSVRDSLKIRAKLRHVNALPNTFRVFVSE